MRLAFLLCLLCLSLSLLAQQNTTDDSQANQPMQVQPEQSAPNPVYPPLQPAAPAGLQPGHALDPNDVTVLTGKSSTTAPASARTPYAAGGFAGGYYPYGMNVPIFGGGQFRSNWGSQPFFRNFGAFNPRLFFRFGSRGQGPVIIFPVTPHR